MFKKIVFTLVVVALVAGSGYCNDIDREIIEKTIDVDNGRFILDIDVDLVKLTVTGNNDSDQCRVYVEYNADDYEADVRYDRKKNKLRIVADKDEWFGKKNNEDCNSDSHGCNSGNNNVVEVKIELPYNVETEISTEIKAGDIEFQLGDLSITKFDLRCLAGKTIVDFKEPNRAAMKVFDVHCSVGETKLLNLGNAHFCSARINSGIGELDIDFRGDRINDCYAKIDLDIGETDITVPDDTGVKVRVSRFMFFSNARYPRDFTKNGHNYYSKNYNDSDNKLNLAVSSGLGGLDIRAE